MDTETIAGVLTALFTGALALLALVGYWRSLRADARRVALKELLGEHMDELTRKLLVTNTYDEYSAWELRLQRLISAGLGRAEEHWVLEVTPYAMAGMPLLDSEEERIKVLKRLHLRVQKLLRAMDSIPIRADFKPKKWTVKEYEKRYQLERWQEDLDE